MKVILNSDILYHHGTVVRELSRGLGGLFEACVKNGHEIVVPLTARLEFDRHQREQADEERRRLSAAYGLLDRYEVAHNRPDPSSIVVEPDLLVLISTSGAAAAELPPTPDDLADAHLRASLHLSPHPPKAKSDEMRDLVIWAQAVRLAQDSSDGALLISRDEVHVHARGDTEAAAAGLVRVASVEEALEFFEVRTPAGQIIEDLLSRAWSSARSANATLPASALVKSVSHPVFIQGKSGLAVASASIRLVGGEEALHATVRFTLEEDEIRAVDLSDLRLGEASLPDISVGVAIPVELDPQTPTDDDLASLREVLDK